jgi:hypothetical protein
VLEAIDDAPYRSIVERRVLRRVGMRSSIPLITDAVRSRLPASYVAEACGAGYLEQPWFEYRAADGSIISTAEDMLAYARMILNRGAIAGGRLISERAFALLTTPVQENYAYGLRVRTQGDDLQIGHSGAIAGFRAGMVAHMNHGFAMVFLGNGPIDQEFAQWITTAVRGALKGQAIPAAPAAPTSEAARKAQAAFAGPTRHRMGRLSSSRTPAPAWCSAARADSAAGGSWDPRRSARRISDPALLGSDSAREGSDRRLPSCAA